MERKIARSGKSRRAVRPACGQALVESTAMMGVMIAFVAMLCLALLNTYFASNYNFRLQYIANEAARQISAKKWWLGMRRPEYKTADAEAEALATINAELKTMGLPEASGFHTTYDTIELQRKETTLVRVDFDVDVIKNPIAMFGPRLVTMHAGGVSSDSEHAITMHGMALIQPVTNPNEPMGRAGVRVPVYNVTVGKKTAAHPHWMRAGLSAGEYPVAYLRLEAKHYGQLSRLTDGQTSETAPWGNF